MEVDVEVLDLTDEQGRVLLLSIDPLADLALVQDEIHERLMVLTPTDSPDLEAFWKEAQETIDSAFKKNPRRIARLRSSWNSSSWCSFPAAMRTAFPCFGGSARMELHSGLTA